MCIRLLLRFFLRVVAPVAVLSTAYLYLYPVFHGCAFPSVDGSVSTSFRDTISQHLPFDTAVTNINKASLPPFRLLVLADPQLEGDSSLPKPEDGFVPRLKSHWSRVRNGSASDQYITAAEAVQKIFCEEIPSALNALRKRVDLFGNDYYLAHIYRTLYWWSKPSHVTVLGDLIGSQWVSDDEFDWRGWRFWNRVFAGGRRVEDEISTLAEGEKEKVFKITDESWKTRIINIAGNHDIGYAGDISKKRMERFERVFGKANWDIRFEYPLSTDSTLDNVVPSLHMVVLNSLNLDTPALSEEVQTETYDYLNSVISSRVRPVEDRNSFTLLLTHLPLHKKAGICVDGPMFDFWGSDDGGGAYRPHGVKEQNHLSDYASQPGTLELLFGMCGDLSTSAQGRGRNGLILTGHDHEGCDVFHFIPSNSTWRHGEQDIDEQKKTHWEAVRWSEAASETSHTGIREVTLRSMMGEFSGNAGLLSAWFDFVAGEWRYEIQMCKIGVQHIWWAVHILDIIVAVLLALDTVMSLTAGMPPSGKPASERKKAKKQHDAKKK